MQLQPRLHQFLVENNHAEEFRIASAYVSKRGVEQLGRILDVGRFPRVKLIAGLDDNFTDPTALELAAKHGADVRLIRLPESKFHVKFYWARHRVGGEWYVGSANLTGKGLQQNAELGVVSSYDDTLDETVASTWQGWWNRAAPLDDGLADYRQRFSQTLSQRRLALDLQPLLSTPPKAMSQYEVGEAIAQLRQRLDDLHARFIESASSSGPKAMQCGDAAVRVVAGKLDEERLRSLLADRAPDWIDRVWKTRSNLVLDWDLLGACVRAHDNDVTEADIDACRASSSVRVTRS